MKKTKFVPPLVLKVGDKIIESSTGHLGVVEKVITSERYAVAFGNNTRILRASTMRLAEERR